MIVSTDNVPPSLIVGAGTASGTNFFAYTYNLIDWYKTPTNAGQLLGLCLNPTKDETLVKTNDNSVGKPASLLTGPITGLSKKGWKNAGTNNTGYYVTGCGKIFYLNDHFVLLDGNGYFTTNATGSWVRITIVAGANLVDATYSNSYYVVSSGTAITRSTSVSVGAWGTISPGWANPSVFAVKKNNAGLLVTGGGSATGTTSGRISSSSDDGATWTLRFSGVTNRIYDIIWVDTLSMFIALTQTGEIITSSDGIAWTVQVTAGSILASGSSLAYSPYFGKVIAFATAVGAGNTIMVSDNGINWVPVPVNLAGWTGSCGVRQVIVGR